jgi:peptidoglycan/xylan/chitin deacetylase (PgdA/CDA1 family)
LKPQIFSRKNTSHLILMTFDITAYRASRDRVLRHIKASHDWENTEGFIADGVISPDVYALQLMRILCVLAESYGYDECGMLDIETQPQSDLLGVANPEVKTPRRLAALLRLLRKKGMRFVTVSELVENPGATRCVALTFDDGFADNYLFAYPLLKRYGAKATIYLAADITGIEKLSPAQIQEMYDSGLVEFGAHTVNHINLLRSDDELAREEIASSRQRVIDIVGRCDSFAYPFGRFAARHEVMVRDAGYSSAVSTRKDIAPFTEQTRYHIPRISSHGEMNTVQWRIALAKGRWRL